MISTMLESSLSKRTADLVSVAALSAEARALIGDGVAPRQFFERLVDAHMYRDAIRWLPHLLPKPAAVWWGCLCAWEVYRPSPPAAVDDALQAAMRWVVEPSDNHRYAAGATARAAGCGSIAGTLALAVLHSGGSLRPPKLSAYPPQPWRTARLVGLSVYLASCTFPHQRYDAVRRQFLEMGRDVAERRLLWLPVGRKTTAAAIARPSMVAGQKRQRSRRKRRVAVA